MFRLAFTNLLMGVCSIFVLSVCWSAKAKQTCCCALQAIVRGVCAIIDAFHFNVASQMCSSAEIANGKELAEEEAGLQGKEQAAVEATSHQEGVQSAHFDIQLALTRRVLPSLRSQLVHDGEVSTFVLFATFVADCMGSLLFRVRHKAQSGKLTRATTTSSTQMGVWHCRQLLYTLCVEQGIVAHTLFSHPWLHSD